MKSLWLEFGLLSCLFFNYVLAAGVTGWDYDNQNAWLSLNDSYCDGRRQSPIHINSSRAVAGDHLKVLTLSRWDEVIDGVFANVQGATVQFQSPSNVASFTNHRGTYDLVQFHIHWGRNDSEGSEHKVDDNKYAAEIHFVTVKRGESNATVGDYISVLGVLCEADPEGDITVSPWNQLKAPIIANDEENVTGLLYTELLPDNLDYFHYEGSLTTPPCSEVVQWFVLRTPIKIPSAFLEQLRLVHDLQDHNLTYNYREAQPDYSRTLFLSPASSANRVRIFIGPLIALCLFVAVMIWWTMVTLL